jgi:hypothetical protein
MSSSHHHHVHEERRRTKRQQPDELPWIKEISITGRRGQLLNLSNSGVYFETGARLLPGRKTFVLLTTERDTRERLQGVIVRSELVRFDAGEAVYRSAVEFVRDFDLSEGDAPASSRAHVAIDFSTRVVELVEGSA